MAGTPLDEREPEPQSPPEKGPAPRVNVAVAARRVSRLPHLLAGYVGADGFPLVVPVAVGETGPDGFELTGPRLAAGGRRAGLMGHRFGPQLVGLETRQYTGWLLDGTYAPHTENGFRAPANKTLLLLANGYMARRGLKKAQALGRG